MRISAHNLFQNNGKRNLFSQNWSDNDAKNKKKKKKKKKKKNNRKQKKKKKKKRKEKKRLQDFYDIVFARVGDKMTKTGTADLMKCASKIYF